MLAEFHKTQNARKPKSVHATYLLTGTPRNSEQNNGFKIRKGEDTDMRSSPFISSMPDQEEDGESDYASDSDDEDTPAPRGVKETQVLLIREEELEGTLCQGSLWILADRYTRDSRRAGRRRICPYLQPRTRAARGMLGFDSE